MRSSESVKFLEENVDVPDNSALNNEATTSDIINSSCGESPLRNLNSSESFSVTLKQERLHSIFRE
ncbi:hypothetical protein Mgra_00004885 [Meloidogyne graminicola]|uniref:Uncharacterized protein n=1 Tax=Meloidogyne graminicola TaxID=189291 RepID=A0A8S9ZQY2_9BILA|nr:hypothetical protein Mgra_00004885 [Meloidogyne graminicola]